jgi:hypothetical protein
METQAMTDDDYARKLNEADRLLNDPDVPLLPALIWRLLAEVSEHDLQDRTVLSHVTHLAPKLCTEKAPSDQCYNVGA